VFKFIFKVMAALVLFASITLLYQKHKYDYQSLVQIDPTIETERLIAKNKYADAQEYLDYFMQFDYVKEMAKAQTLKRLIDDKRASYTYKKEKIIEGVTTGKSDELSGQISAIASDFFVIGDIRDLYIEGKHYLNKEKVDKVLLSLSAIGLVATAGSIVTLGSTSVAKSGLSVMKVARKTNKIPQWLEKYILKSAKEIKKTKNLKRLKPLLKSIDDIYKKVGLKLTLDLLSVSTDMKTLSSIGKVSKRYGKESKALIALSKGKIIKQGSALKGYKVKTIKLASSYGENGFKSLLKNGEKNFLKSVKRIKAYAKVGYKGEIWKVFMWLLKNISDKLLVVLSIFTALILFPYQLLFKKKAEGAL